MTPEAPRQLWVNGEAVQSAAADLVALLQQRGFDPASRGFVCAVNGAFVPRAGWSQQSLQAGDRIDIVAPVVGG